MTSVTRRKLGRLDFATIMARAIEVWRENTECSTSDDGSHVVIPIDGFECLIVPALHRPGRPLSAVVAVCSEGKVVAEGSVMIRDQATTH